MQRDEAWVKAASAEDLLTAQRAGELAHYLGGLTAEETAHAAHVAGSRDRIVANLYGYPSMSELRVAAKDSSWTSAKRRNMSPEKLAMLERIEASTPEQAYGAEMAGELDHVLGRDVAAEDARLEAVSAHVRAVVGGV